MSRTTKPASTSAEATSVSTITTTLEKLVTTISEAITSASTSSSASTTTASTSTTSDTTTTTPSTSTITSNPSTTEASTSFTEALTSTISTTISDLITTASTAGTTLYDTVTATTAHITEQLTTLLSSTTVEAAFTTAASNITTAIQESTTAATTLSPSTAEQSDPTDEPSKSTGFQSWQIVTAVVATAVVVPALLYAVKKARDHRADKRAQLSTLDRDTDTAFINPIFDVDSAIQAANLRREHIHPAEYQEPNQHGPTLYAYVDGTYLAPQNRPGCGNTDHQPHDYEDIKPSSDYANPKGPQDPLYQQASAARSSASVASDYANPKGPRQPTFHETANTSASYDNIVGGVMAAGVGAEANYDLAQRERSSENTYELADTGKSQENPTYSTASSSTHYKEPLYGFAQQETRIDFSSTREENGTRIDMFGSQPLYDTAAPSAGEYITVSEEPFYDAASEERPNASVEASSHTALEGKKNQHSLV